MSEQQPVHGQWHNAPGVDDCTPWLNELRRRRQAGPMLKSHRLLNGNERLATQCVHAGTYEDRETGAVGTPIFPTTTFKFTQATYDSFLEGFVRDIPTYTRYGHPNQWSIQLKMAALEGAESALVLASGMAAISSTLLGLTNRSGHVISSYDVYGGSYNLLHSDLHQMGRTVSYVDPLDIEAVTAAIRSNTQVMFFELLSNPLLKAVDLTQLAEVCRRRNILLIIDNTFLTPISCRPLDFGADIVLHSGTKYLNGHGDVTCGVVAGSRKLVDRVWTQMLKFGGQLDPFVCFLLERGMKTLSLRMDVHRRRAQSVTAFLESHPQVLKVYSPYSNNYAYPALRKYAPDVACGILSFEVEGGNAAALRLLEHLQLITTATSFGGVESLISLPFNTSHSGLTLRQQKSIGLNTGLVRLSVGIEDSEDLCEDLAQAFTKAYTEDAV